MNEIVKKPIEQAIDLVKASFEAEIPAEQREAEMGKIVNNLKLICLRHKKEPSRELFLRALEFYKMGLDISPQAQHIYWINWQGVEGMITPMGIAYLLGKDGFQATTNVVYEGDSFECDLAELKVTHKASLSATGKIEGAYSLIRQGNAIVLVELLRVGDIDTIRSKAKTTKVWDEFEGEMVRKACLKRAIKRLSFNSKSGLQEAIDSDNSTFFDLKKERMEINNGKINPAFMQAIQGENDE